MAKTILLAVLAALVCACYAQQATPVCSVDADCHDLTSVKTKFCNIISSSATCSDQAKVSLGTTTLDTKRNYCENSYMRILTCVNLYGEGCAKPAQTALPYSICAGGNWNGATCQLTPPDNSTKTFKAAGEACDLFNPCGYNLYCKRKICYKLPPAGEFCLDGQCTAGNICNLGRCVAKGSLAAGSGCNSNDVCSSGSCTANILQPSGFCSYAFRNQRCYTNYDCSSGATLAQCDNRNKNSLGQGICFNPYPVTQQAVTDCVAAQCSSQYYPDFKGDIDSCVQSKCEKQFIYQQCARRCPLRLDFQFDENLPYRFDCKAITMTKLSSTDCGVATQYVNCDSYYSYQNSAFTQKSSWMFVLAAIALVFMLI